MARARSLSLAHLSARAGRSPFRPGCGHELEAALRNVRALSGQQFWFGFSKLAAIAESGESESGSGRFERALCSFFLEKEGKINGRLILTLKGKSTLNRARGLKSEFSSRFSAFSEILWGKK